MVSRIYVEKRHGYQVEAEGLKKELIQNLHLNKITGVRVINVYDVEGLGEVELELVTPIVFSEPNIDHVTQTIDLAGVNSFGVEYLPGQFNQRAESARECIEILCSGALVRVRSFKIIGIEGTLDHEDLERIKGYIINPVDSREARLDVPTSLEFEAFMPDHVELLAGFIQKSIDELVSFHSERGFAMTVEDLVFCQNYFIEEDRDPTITELKAIDTYWSDHCRHTTFLTSITAVTIEASALTTPIQKAYDRFKTVHAGLYPSGDRPTTLMEIATVAMKAMKKSGELEDLDISEEINACSIVVPTLVDGKVEDYLVMFKNETHNHPTEIEPFGGAATCLGGAIRDPLSGRSYVYQAMRVTGAADPRVAIEDTLPGKLPQYLITKGAAKGYSSYGNQIGLATGQVAEVYHPNFVAKRMEIGAVIAAAPKDNVIRTTPETGDVVILVGGRTGRDGCGGATGSSKEHDEESILSCGAEVQKGNAPTERKLQRLFRNKRAAQLIKRCNDFGAGGVSVAIGELSESIDIFLDTVPKKYAGLDGTELAISESQERMAVVLSPENEALFLELAAEENLEATKVALITDTGRLRMFWQSQKIMDISREFLDTNGVQQTTGVRVTAPTAATYFDAAIPTGFETGLQARLSDLNICSKKGLVEMFDSTIGMNTVLMPFGGKNKATYVDGMIAKIPVVTGDTTTATTMTYGYDPDLALWSPFHGAYYAVLHSVAKSVALGTSYRQLRLTLQEYFEKLGKDQVKWGKPFSALLGAFAVQDGLRVPAIGGKDSMSGTFKDIHVPPTLVSFAVSAMDVSTVVTPEFKALPSTLVAYLPTRLEDATMDFSALEAGYTAIEKWNKTGKLLAATAIGRGGMATSLVQMAIGNGVGTDITSDLSLKTLFDPCFGGLVLQLESGAAQDLPEQFIIIGSTNERAVLSYGNVNLSLEALQSSLEAPLEKVFPSSVDERGTVENLNFTQRPTILPKGIARPKVFVPAFPGTNCELDTLKAFEKAGAEGRGFIFRNQSASDIEASIDQMVKEINNAQMIAIPGGFSAGDEPDGSAKFIAAVFQSPKVREAVMRLLNERDGLMLGICNGFQALIKLGLLTYGDIRPMLDTDPTLTYNTIGRHVSAIVRTRITSTNSPWMQGVEVGQVYGVAMSHGEGRFMANEEWLDRFIANGQIISQYVDPSNNATYDGRYNINGSLFAVEGLVSPNGRVLGKMGHSERIGKHLYKNILDPMDIQLFESGVKYFK